MEKDLDNSLVQNTSLKESENDKSFVGKVKSIISNTPLSKWFRKQDDNRPVIRRRDEVFEDEDISEVQPPSKRVKLPASDGGSNCNNILFHENCVPATNNVSNNIFHKIPEPVAGPSGLKSHKSHNSATTVSVNSVRNTFSSNELLNGHSDSEESTSGYSSVARIGSKEQVCESRGSSKQTSPAQRSPSNTRSLFHKSSANLDRSLFAERSLSPNMNTSLSSRRPNFNASTFGSPNFVDKTISTKRIINSPFYNGKTIYGGASAYGRNLGRTSQDLKTSLRNSVQIKPVNKTTENGNLVLGKTARRILDTIEQYSSPINDAKKIPIVSRKLRQEGLLSKYAGANPYMIRETKIPSNKELQIPTVPDLLRMKARLQESTESVRQIAASSKSDLNTEYYKIHTTENEKGKHTGKIKTKVTSVRPKLSSNEIVKEVNLTPVSLPITTLPKFDFVIPPPLATKNISKSPETYKTTQQSHTSKSSNAQPSPKTIQTEYNVQKEKKITTTTLIEYKFSDPLVVAENIKSIVAINNFKFSDPPTCTKNKSNFSKSTMLNFKMPESKLANLFPNKRTNSETPVKTAKALKTGSVMDILGKKDNLGRDPLLEKFKPAQGTWECSVCMIRNQQDKTRCAACETPKTRPAKQTDNKSTLNSQFKLSSDKWECKSCMVHNNNSENKCVCCSTPKSVTTVASKESVFDGFGDKFKPSGNTWECGVCMIRNKIEMTKCAACETPNPKASTVSQLPSLGKSEPSNGIKNKQLGFGNTFKAKNDEWECSTCMVRNKSCNEKCQCCETPNPKCSSTSRPALGIGKDKKPLSSFNFGIDKAATTSFSFGIPATASVTPPKTDIQVTTVFSGAAKPTSDATITFSFGIPPSTQTESKATESLSKPPAEPPKSNETAPVLTTSNPLLKQDDKLPEKTRTVPVEFQFGVTAPTTSFSTNKRNLSQTSILKSDAPSLTTTNTTDKNKPVFNLKPAATNGDVSGTLFGNKPDATLKATPATTSAGLFGLGTKPAAAAAPLVSLTESSRPEPPKHIFKFGPTTENPSFGSANAMATITTLNNGFGNKNTPSFGMSKMPNFDKPATKSTEVKPFTFSSGTTKEASEPASKVPMFSFGQSATIVAVPSAAAKMPGFNFGATTAAPAFNFATGKTENPSFNNAPAPTSNVFGTSTNTGGTQNGTFNFGNVASNNNNQKASFSFGAAANNAAGSGSQSGFNFGAPAASFASTPGGFNFSGAAPIFNASAKPSFNFTDGSVAAFSAQPPTDGNASAPRKIKRAVRRTQR